MRRIGSVLAIGLILAGCTAARSIEAPRAPDGATATPAPATPATGYELPASPDALVLRIDTDGGLMGPGAIPTHVPEFSLYADGRAITIGAVMTIYPGPLLPNVLEATLTPAEMQKTLAAADQSGLLGPDASFWTDGIADAPTTVFTTTANGITHTMSAYALGINAAATSADASARDRLVVFRSKMWDLGSFLGRQVASTPYEPKAMRLFFGIPAQVEPNVTQQEDIWPLKRDPITGTATNRYGLRCMALTGSDLQAFMPMARTANAITVWKAPSGKYSVSVRPLLPEETGCPAA